MATVERGIKCKRCGKIVAPIWAYTNDYCQKCGAYILDNRYQKEGRKVYHAKQDGQHVVVKIRNFLFFKTYKVLEEIEGS